MARRSAADKAREEVSSALVLHMAGDTALLLLLLLRLRLTICEDVEGFGDEGELCGRLLRLASLALVGMPLQSQTSVTACTRQPLKG